MLAFSVEGSGSEVACSWQSPVGEAVGITTDSLMVGAEDETATAAKVMSLKDCMEYAVENAAQVQTQRTKVGDARLDRRDAILTAFTPSVEASTYGYYRWGRSIDPETNTYVTTTSLNNGWSVSAGITLFDGFSTINNIKIAKTSLSMGLTQERQEEDKVCLATMEAYFNVLYYTELVNILAEQVENAQSALTLASRQEELGVKGHADVVQMEADLADREYELVSARNSLTDAKITLEDVMLWPVGEELVIDTSLGSLDAATSDDSGISDNSVLAGDADFSGPAGDANFSGNGSGAPGNVSVDDIILKARSSMPAVLVAKGNLDKAKYALRTAQWQFLPTLGLYGGWSTSYYTYPGQSGYTPTPYWSQFSNNGGEYLQLSLTIPIYDRLSKFTKLSKRRNEYRRAAIEYDKSLRDVESEVRRAVSDRDGAESALLQAERRADAQEEAYRLNFRKFEQGLISSIEYNTASSNYLKAKAERLNALLKWQLKRRVVSYYNGVRYIDQE